MDPEHTLAGLCVFLSDPESKIWEKPDPDPESLFNSGSSRSLRNHFLSNNFDWIDGSRSRILKFEKFPDLKILEERNRSLKK